MEFGFWSSIISLTPGVYDRNSLISEHALVPNWILSNGLQTLILMECTQIKIMYHWTNCTTKHSYLYTSRVIGAVIFLTCGHYAGKFPKICVMCVLSKISISLQNEQRKILEYRCESSFSKSIRIYYVLYILMDCTVRILFNLYCMQLKVSKWRPETVQSNQIYCLQMKLQTGSWQSMSFRLTPPDPSRHSVIEEFDHEDE